MIESILTNVWFYVSAGSLAVAMILFGTYKSLKKKEDADGPELLPPPERKLCSQHNNPIQNPHVNPPSFPSGPPSFPSVVEDGVEKPVAKTSIEEQINQKILGELNRMDTKLVIVVERDKETGKWKIMKAKGKMRTATEPEEKQPENADEAKQPVKIKRRIP